jgi:hypothetical protein
MRIHIFTTTTTTTSLTMSQQLNQLMHDTDSIYLQLLIYWTTCMNDIKNLAYIYMPYIHALHTIKSLILTSTEWKKSLTQNIIAFLSLPWLANETQAFDLELFKDKSFKQCSANLIQHTPKHVMFYIKQACMQMLCLLPKNSCSQWRTQLISKCIRNNADNQADIELKQCAIRYLPYLIYFLGVAANSLVFQLIHPAMQSETHPKILKSYACLLGTICCLVSRKSLVIRKSTYKMGFKSESSSDELESIDFDRHFEIVCTCCDKKRIQSSSILSNIQRRKNLDTIQMLFNRPKNVDNQVLIQFIYALSNANELKVEDEKDQGEIKSILLRNLERAFNHIDFGRSSNSSSTNNNNSSSSIYKEALNLLCDDSINALDKFDFARSTISKMVNQQQQMNQSDLKLNDEQQNHPQTALILSKAFSLLTNNKDNKENEKNNIEIDSFSNDHNFNLELKMCEGFLRAKTSKNLLDIFMFVIGLGRLAISFNQTRAKPDEYIFLCVKHLLEIASSSSYDKTAHHQQLIMNVNEENNDPIKPSDSSEEEWNKLCSDLAQRELNLLSKKVNMRELLAEFEDKVCEIVSDTIYTTIDRVSSSQSSSSYLQSANHALKSILKVFNYVDSNGFVRTYQRYLVPYITNRTIDTRLSKLNYKIITKSLEFLSRKVNTTIPKLVEDNFPYIFTYTTLNSFIDIAHVFQYIANEIGLDIDKLINNNKQRLFNELLSKCGNTKMYKLKCWQAVCLLTAANNDEATNAMQSTTIDDKRIVKSIEPGLLAVLVHFDMCLLKSTINLKEKCQVLESLNVIMGMLGTQLITQVRYKIMTTLKLAMQQCSKLSELNCKLWDTFLRNIDKSALGAILNQVSVNLLQLIDLQPYKISKIFEYLIIQNREHLEPYFQELYFIPSGEHSCLQQVNQVLKKYIDIKHIIEQSNLNSVLMITSSTTTTNTTSSGGASSSSTIETNSIKALIYLIKQYLKGKICY